MQMALPDFDKLWDYEHPASTEKTFRNILPMAVITGNLSYRVQLMTQIARAQGLQGRYDEAHRTLDHASLLLVDSGKGLFVPQIRGMLERGRVFNTAGNKERARELFMKAWLLAFTQGEDSYAIDAAHMMGIVEPTGDQLAWNLKALELAEGSTDERAAQWLASLYNNIGWTYHDLGDHTKALDMFQRGLRLRQQRGQRREAQIARWAVARALRSLQRIEEALEEQQALLADLNTTGEVDGFVHEELAECLLALDQDEAARPHFARAYEELSQDTTLAEREPERLARLKRLGGV
jgi:tetratricopeptide (TPR) repeat protein